MSKLEEDWEFISKPYEEIFNNDKTFKYSCKQFFISGASCAVKEVTSFIVESKGVGIKEKFNAMVDEQEQLASDTLVILNQEAEQIQKEIIEEEKGLDPKILALLDKKC